MITAVTDDRVYFVKRDRQRGRTFCGWASRAMGISHDAAAGRQFSRAVSYVGRSETAKWIWTSPKPFLPEDCLELQRSLGRSIVQARGPFVMRGLAQAMRGLV